MLGTRSDRVGGKIPLGGLTLLLVVAFAVQPGWITDLTGLPGRVSVPARAFATNQAIRVVRAVPRQSERPVAQVPVSAIRRGWSLEAEGVVRGARAALAARPLVRETSMPPPVA